MSTANASCFTPLLLDPAINTPIALKLKVFEQRPVF